MPIERIAFAGWSDCLRIFNAHAEIIVTTEVGPRVISYRTLRGENVLWVNPEDAGKTGEPDFQVRGGHRFWTSPEDERSYAPDNVAVSATIEQPLTVVLVNPAAAPWHIRKTLTVTLGADDSTVQLDHRLTNEGPAPEKLAPWALTVMNPGGFEVIPQPPYRAHGTGGFLAERVVVPWSYTDFSDPRWKFQSRFWMLVPAPKTEATKIGLVHRAGWVAWSRRDALFVKRFGYDPVAEYPDFGCNFETFTKGDFLELESLGPLRTLQPGESVSHTETWHLFDDATPPADRDDAALESWLSPFLSKTRAL